MVISALVVVRPAWSHDGLTNLECPGSPNLNLSNRPVRTRMPGGVAGVRSHRSPPMPIGNPAGVRLLARFRGVAAALADVRQEDGQQAEQR